MSPGRIHGLLFAVLWFSYAFVHQGHKSPIALSRLDALQAVWNHGTWRIDAYHSNTPDKALVNGHYYSDKAPGTLLMAAPGFVASAVVLNACGVATDSPKGWLFTSWATSMFGVGLIAAMGGVAFFAWLGRRVSERAALVTTLAVFLGAAPFPYSTMLFSHAAVAGMICVALWALDETGNAERGAENTKPEKLSAGKKEALGGLCFGLALASEYTAGLVIVGLLACFAVCDRRKAMRAGLWMTPPLLLIPAYSWMCFGTPFTIGYAHNATFAHLQSGFFGIHPPDAENAWRLLFGQARGLFFWTPFLLLALAGYTGLARADGRMFWAAYLIPVVDVAVLSGNNVEWMGGPSLGPRYLAPMLPLLALPAAFAAQRWPRTAIALAVLSILLTGMGTLLNASLPMGKLSPLTEVLWPALLTGQCAPNLGEAAGLTGLWSLTPVLAVWGGGIGFLVRGVVTSQAILIPDKSVG
jgi:hypothetical protein